MKSVSKNDFDGSLIHGLSNFDKETGRSAYFEALKNHVKSLLDKNGNFPPGLLVKRSCVVCNGDKFEDVFVKDGFKHVICQECNMLQVNPIPSSKVIKEFYQSPIHDRFVTEVYSSPIQLKMDSLKWRYLMEKIATYINKDKNKPWLIEVGCGIGNFLLEARKRNYRVGRVTGFELNTQAVSIACSKGLEVKEAFIEEYVQKYRNKVDMVVMWDVLEHMESPSHLLKSIKEILRPGGLFALIVPNADSLVSRLLKEECDTFGATSSMHLNFFDTNTLSQFLNRYSFELLHIETIISELRRVLKFLNRNKVKSDVVNYDWLTADFIHKHLLGHKIFTIARNKY